MAWVIDLKKRPQLHKKIRIFMAENDLTYEKDAVLDILEQFFSQGEKQ